MLLLLVVNLSTAMETESSIKISCEDYSWNEVLALVQPYLDDTLYVALVMQGQSVEYNVSEAAIQAFDNSLPDNIQRILEAIIEAKCS